jgi:hypothetical protein
MCVLLGADWCWLLAKPDGHQELALTAAKVCSCRAGKSAVTNEVASLEVYNLSL